MVVSFKAVIDLRASWGCVGEEAGAASGVDGESFANLSRPPRCYDTTSICVFCAQFFDGPNAQQAYRPVAEEKKTEVRPIGEAKLNLIFYPYFPDALKYREAKLNLIFYGFLRLRGTDTASLSFTSPTTQTTCPPSPDRRQRTYQRFVVWALSRFQLLLSPQYYGWTHSENADSWFLEAHTASLHEDYEGFYDEALKKRVICPKFYSCVA